MTTQQIALLILGSVAFIATGLISFLTGNHTLSIKAKTVGDGQHGTARWASNQEIAQTYAHVPFTPKLWREQKSLPEKQGIVVGCKTALGKVTALVDTGDVHAMMIGAAGVGKEGAEIIWDNAQLTIFGGFAPNSETANTLSKNLGEKTVMSGSISKGKGDGSKSLQMMGRSLITPDELKAMPKGQFIVAKTGCCPMRSTLKLFTQWGISFDKEYQIAEAPPRVVEYADRLEIEAEVLRRYPQPGMAIPDDDDDFDDQRDAGPNVAHGAGRGKKSVNLKT